MSYGRIRFPRTIVDGKLQFLSVSQVEAYADPVYGCPRKWAFDKLEGLKGPSDFARDLGVETHELIDHYVTTGEDVLNPVARAGKHLIYAPPPDGLEVEHESLGEVSLAGMPFYVRLDLWNRRDYWLDDDGQRLPQAGATEVLDWKTTGDVGAKPRGGVALLGTVQMPVYGLWALGRTGDAAVRLSHAYFGTRRREARKISYLATRAEVEDRAESIARTVEAMKVSAGALRAADLRPNLEACREATRSPCPYVGICPRSPAQSLAAVGIDVERILSERLAPASDKEKTMGLMDLLKKQNSPAPAAAAAAPPAEAPPAPPAPSQAEIDAEIARLEAERAARQTPVMVTGAAAEALGAPPGGGYIGVVPLDAPAPGTTGPIAKEIPPETLLTMPPPIKAAAAKVAAMTTAAPASAPPPAEAAPAPKSTRAKKAPAESAAPVDPPPPPGGVIVGLSLFVDCVPEGVASKSLDGYVTDLCAMIAEAEKVTDIRCAPGDSVLGFGKWKGVLAHFVRAKPPESGAYTVAIDGSELRQVVVEALKPTCALYVRGIR